MVNSERIINQVIEGPLPATWRVFRGRGGNPIGMAIFASLFIFLAVCICQGMFIMVGAMFMGGTLFSMLNSTSNSVPYDPSPSSGTIDPTSFHSPTPFPFGVPLVGLVALFLLLPLLIALFFARKSFFAAHATNDSMLVITPDGVVHCTNVSQPSHRASKVLDFAEINDLQLRMQTHHDSTTTTDASTGITTTRTTGSHTDFWLDVQGRNGSHQRWPLAFHDSRPEILAQYIIEAYARYRPQL